MAEHLASITWQRGSDVFLDRRYHRAHQWQFDGGATVAASSSPHVVPLPYSDAAAVDPEEAFVGQSDAAGSHTARFGEIEQRGAALTPAGRALYDQLLNEAREDLGEFPNEANAQRYADLLEQRFEAFPDSYTAMRREGLAYFRYFVTEAGKSARRDETAPRSLDALIEAGHVHFEPLVYEDFLPVSAAGIFQSNLGDDAQVSYDATSNQQAFHAALGATVRDELALYAETQRRSLAECAKALGLESLG